LKQFKTLIRRSDWPADIPEHLYPRFILFDSSGKDQVSGRDLKNLLESHPPDYERKNAEILGEQEQKVITFWEEGEYTTWDFEGLPETIPLYTQQGDPSGFLYPSLIPHPDRGYAKIQFNKIKPTAENQNRAGMLYLYRLHFSDQYKALRKMCKTSLSGPSTLWLFENGLDRKQRLNSLIDFIMRSIFGRPPGTMEPLSVFNEKIEKVKTDGFYKNGTLIFNNLMSLFRKRKAVSDSIHNVFSTYNGAEFLSGDKHILFKQLIDEIVASDFLINGEDADIEKLCRRLQSLAIRLERFSVNPGKDELKEKQLFPHLENLKKMKKKEEELPVDAMEQYEKYRQMIAEFRIKIFSPEIKTCMPVSSKRLLQQWQTVLEKC